MAIAGLSAGTRLTAAALTAAFDRTRWALQTSDQFSTASTTLVNSTTLTLPVAANTWYLYGAVLFYTAGTTGDFQHNVLLPSGAAILHGTWTPVATVSATNTTVAVDGLTATGFNSGGLGTGTIMSLRPTGAILTGGTAGSVTIQFAQAVSNATTTTLKAGSKMFLTKAS